MIQLLLIGAGVSILLGALLAAASILLKVDEDPRIAEISSMLPQANCGACGNPGCRAMAEAIVREESKLGQCKPLGDDAKSDIVEYIKSTPNEEGEYIKVKI